MPDSTVNTISFEKYLTLLRDAAPDTVDLYACDVTGSIIASDDRNAHSVSTVSNIIARKLLSEHNYKPGVASLAPGERKHLLMPVCNTLDEPFAYLIAILNKETESREQFTDNLINRSLPAVASCIEKEYKLTAELDDMAHDLAGRYEELNLIYETTDEITNNESEESTLTNLIEKYVEHLGVDMMALAFPRQERVFSVANSTDPIPGASNIINNLAHTYDTEAGNDGKLLLINDFTDQQRDKYHLQVPCKIMASPVPNSRGGIDGILICINHIQRPDFYNSDKNLLHVISKKVAKVMHSNYDTLTGLINQRAFENVIQKAVNSSRKNDLFHCVLNIDLDKLKVINETYGRDAGDHIIKSVANLLESKFRRTDTISYLGEGRYGVLLEECTMDRGMHVSESLLKFIDDSFFTWNSKPVETRITIGVALIEPHTHQSDDILEAVEIARDAAKERGHNRIQLYRLDDDEFAMRKDSLHWVTRIQQALRYDEFALHSQTISPTAPTNENYHFEVLLRMTDKDGSIIPPGRFLPPAEQFNLMPIIDRWVIKRTFATLSSAGVAQASDEGIVSINLSGQSLADHDLTSYIIDNIEKYRIAPDCICFEITETTAIHDTKSAQDIFSQLKSIGCKLSLDDFGTGLSSFSYLKNMPVDYLKIDGSFVRNILTDNVSHAMVASINQVGHVMELKTIAEFVENDELATRLKHIGVDYLQGYGIAKPVSMIDYLSSMHSSPSACAG